MPSVIQLQYLGKKAPITLNLQISPTRKLVLNLDKKEKVLSVDKEDADWLMTLNPLMFKVVGKQSVSIPAVEETSKDDVEEPKEDGNRKFPSQMNKQQLIDYASEQFEVELSNDFTRKELYEKVIKLEEEAKAEK